MRIKRVGMISTGIVITLGILIIIPPYLPQNKPLVVLFFFSVKDGQNVSQWCDQLSYVLEKNNVPATIFVTGKLADQNPNCVTAFSKENDVGSQTYSYLNLAGKNYDTQLSEVKAGKIAVDTVGRIDSRLFKAPYGTTDENIYSILTRSGILADFSYEKQYNKYYNGQFIKFSDTAYDGTAYSVDFFRNLKSVDPVIINFDNTTPVEKIDNFISALKSKHLLFVNASELTGMKLTIHPGERI